MPHDHDHVLFPLSVSIPFFYRVADPFSSPNRLSSPPSLFSSFPSTTIALLVSPLACVRSSSRLVTSTRSVYMYPCVFYTPRSRCSFVPLLVSPLACVRSSSSLPFVSCSVLIIQEHLIHPYSHTTHPTRHIEHGSGRFSTSPALSQWFRVYFPFLRSVYSSQSSSSSEWIPPLTNHNRRLEARSRHPSRMYNNKCCKCTTSSLAFNNN